MVIPDINLLLYAYNSSSPAHIRAKRWWEQLLAGTEPVGLPQVVAFGFLRLSTHSRVFSHPMTVAVAAGHVREWLAQPPVQVLVAMPEHIQQVSVLLERLGTGGNLVTDAQIAALALDYGAVVHTADADFARFPGLRWRNPITGAHATNAK